MELAMDTSEAPISAKSDKKKNFPPKKPLNSERRSREYLTSKEVDKLMEAARKTGRLPNRDSTLILLMFRHALRVSEAVSLRWDMIDFNGFIHVKRLKNGMPSVHPLRGGELRAIRKLERDQIQKRISEYLFVSERGAPLTDRTVRHIVSRAGEMGGFSFPVHPHMLRHACGYYLANKGIDTRAIQHYMGHRNIQHTVRYTELKHDRFKNFWED